MREDKKMAIGERIKIMRVKEGLNQTDFAAKMRVSRATIVKYESDPSSAKPSCDFLAAVLENKWSVNWILAEEGSPLLLAPPLRETKYSYISSVTAAILAKAMAERGKRLKWPAWGLMMRMLFQYAVVLLQEGGLYFEEISDYSKLSDYAEMTNSDLGHELQSYITTCLDVCDTADIFED